MEKHQQNYVDSGRRYTVGNEADIAYTYYLVQQQTTLMMPGEFFPSPVPTGYDQLAYVPNVLNASNRHLSFSEGKKKGGTLDFQVKYKTEVITTSDIH